MPSALRKVETCSPARCEGERVGEVAMGLGSQPEPEACPAAAHAVGVGWGW